MAAMFGGCRELGTSALFVTEPPQGAHSGSPSSFGMTLARCWLFRIPGMKLLLEQWVQDVPHWNPTVFLGAITFPAHQVLNAASLWHELRTLCTKYIGCPSMLRGDMVEVLMVRGPEMVGLRQDMWKVGGRQ